MNAFDEIIRRQITQLRDSGLSLRQAASELGVSYQTLYSKAKRYGIEWRRSATAWDNVVIRARNEDIIARHEAGEIHETIGADYGITRERVRQIIKSAGAEARYVQRDKRLLEIAERVASGPMSVSEAVSATGLDRETIRKAANLAGIVMLKRDSKTTAALAKMSELVKAGVSFRQAAGGDEAKASLLAQYCFENGIKSLAPTRWTANPEERRAIGQQMRSEGKTWGQIAKRIAEVEGTRPIGAASAYVWFSKHAPEILEIKGPLREDGRKRNRPARRVKAVNSDGEVIVKNDVREAAIANYGKVPASQVAKALGVSRNVIIGHWYRARQTGEIAA